jgi:hypothetical protein
MMPATSLLPVQWLDMPLLLDDWLIPDKPTERPDTTNTASFKNVLAQASSVKKTEEKEPIDTTTDAESAIILPLDMLLPLLQQPVSKTDLIKTELPIALDVAAQPIAYMDQIQAVQQHLRQAIHMHGSIQVPVNPTTHVVLQFNHKRVSATYSSSDATTVQQLQHQVHQLKQEAQTEHWPIDTVQVKYEKSSNKQKKRQK